MFEITFSSKSTHSTVQCTLYSIHKNYKMSISIGNTVLQYIVQYSELLLGFLWNTDGFLAFLRSDKVTTWLIDIFDI
jgi:hypothetical protein